MKGYVIWDAHRKMDGQERTQARAGGVHAEDRDGTTALCRHKLGRGFPTITSRARGCYM
jgi:hypothetical protein